MAPEHWRKGTRLVLLGGGVGINPLVSILHHVAAWLEGPEGEKASSGASSGGGGGGKGGCMWMGVVWYNQSATLPLHLPPSDRHAD